MAIATAVAFIGRLENVPKPQSGFRKACSVPIKPLADVEPAVTAAYQTALPALYSKIRP